MIPRALLLALALAVSACAHGRVEPWEYSPRSMADTLPILEPAERHVPLIYDAGHEFLIRPIGEGVVPGGPGPALNPDPMDEVVNSTWFTNRNAVEPLTPEQIRRGPQTVDGPDPSGPVQVKSLNPQGITPKFNIEDASGVRYIVKFEPPDHPELSSAAEVIATNLLWAAGYNLPENYVYHLDPTKLVLDEDLELTVFDEDSTVVTYAVTPDESDEPPLTMEVFQRHFLGRLTRRPDGTIRALASRFLDGIPKGPFSYEGLRLDDPNDVVPHEHRRELRGLYVVEAWLNQTDTKQGNSLDMFILHPRSPEDEEARRFGYLRHNLIDPGASLGSASVRPQIPRHGQENELDLSAMGKRLVTLGLWEQPWQDMDRPQTPPATGYYSIEHFNPGDWKPNMPNPAFDNRQPGDGYWGAKLVMSFTDPQLFAAVEAGRYSDPAAQQYILNGLKARRDLTGRYWFAQVSPLDDPRIVDRAVLVFDDLWIRHFGGPAEYRAVMEWDAPEPDLEFEGTFREARITLPMPSEAVPADDDPEDQRAEVRVWKRQEDGDWAPRPATFWLEWDGSAYRVTGARY